MKYNRLPTIASVRYFTFLPIIEPAIIVPITTNNVGKVEIQDTSFPAKCSARVAIAGVTTENPMDTSGKLNNAITPKVPTFSPVPYKNLLF